MIFCGATGSGKSNMAATLLTDKRFYGECFDAVFLLSPTAKFDAMQNQYGIPKSRIIDDPDKDGAESLKAIMKSQAQAIGKLGAGKAPQLCVVMDDIVHCKQFLRSKEFLKAFIASRHFSLTTILLSQSWTRVPRACRLQATCIFYWRGSQSEQELLYQEYAPPGMNKNHSCN